MKILKFGGTSVGSTDNIKIVLGLIRDYSEQGDSFAIVVSAMGGLTNLLVDMGTRASEGDSGYLKLLENFEQRHFEVIHSLIDSNLLPEVSGKVKGKIQELSNLLHGVFLVRELSPRASDFILSHGERINAYIISMAGQSAGLPTEYLDTRKLIITDQQYGSARVDFATTNENIKRHFASTDKIQIVTGFIACDQKGYTTTLGRGGSDYTASILAAALDASDVEIWTDVDGVMTADPRKVKHAFSLRAISYQEAMEMSHFGAKVIYPPTLQPVFSKKIPIWIKNTFNLDFPGTYISQDTAEDSEMLIKGISSINDIAFINIQGSGMIGVAGFSARLFNSLAKRSVNVILITQASSEHSICIAIQPDESQTAKTAIEEEFYYELLDKKVEQIYIERGLSIIAVIGEYMKNKPGIAGKMFSGLGKNGINIRAIAQGSSELNISAVIAQEDVAKALNALHEEFFLSDIRTLNVFMVGHGLVGATLLRQMAENAPHIRKNRKLKINLAALSNSRKMLIQPEGIDPENWKESLENSGTQADLDTFVDQMIAQNMPNSIFVDNTSNPDIVNYYERILEESINIVTPNKNANSRDLASYQNLKEIAATKGVRFLYETNVGAGLPVINTLQDLMQSGDEIFRIEGVLSGTLSFIFNQYDASNSFASIVKEAKRLGYTEPDPREDLSGADVARKILILAREAGSLAEPQDVQIETLLPQSCLDAPNVDSFFDALEKEESYFANLYLQANAASKRLRFTGKLENGKVSVALQVVGMDHPFYFLSGSDNMISYTTRRYEKNPLVVRGPGAGAEVTAAGVFADIIRIS
jgi:aspartokinase/homoserine dehydrogenase 1